MDKEPMWEYFMGATTPAHFSFPSISCSPAGWRIRSYFCPGGQGGSIGSSWVCRSGSGAGHGFIWNTVFQFEFLTFGSRVLLSFLGSGISICWDLHEDVVGKGRWEWKTAWSKEKERKKPGVKRNLNVLIDPADSTSQAGGKATSLNPCRHKFHESRHHNKNNNNKNIPSHFYL